MKQAILFLVCLAALCGMDPRARQVTTVYLLPMTGGLDQFLASELSKAQVYAVTTDPQKADAVLTDSLGEKFEAKLEELYAPPPPPPPKESDSDVRSPVISSPQPVRMSTWGRGKGTVFLVDRKTGTVLWSMNRQPKNTSAKEMTEQAEKVVARLKKDLAAPSAAQ